MTRCLRNKAGPRQGAKGRTQELVVRVVVVRRAAAAAVVAARLHRANQGPHTAAAPPRNDARRSARAHERQSTSRALAQAPGLRSQKAGGPGSSGALRGLRPSAPCRLCFSGTKRLGQSRNCTTLRSQEVGPPVPFSAAVARVPAEFLQKSWRNEAPALSVPLFVLDERRAPPWSIGVAGPFSRAQSSELPRQQAGR